MQARGCAVGCSPVAAHGQLVCNEGGVIEADSLHGHQAMHWVECQASCAPLWAHGWLEVHAYPLLSAPVVHPYLVVPHKQHGPGGKGCPNGRQVLCAQHDWGHQVLWGSREEGCGSGIELLMREALPGCAWPATAKTGATS